MTVHGHARARARVIHTGQVVVDVTMRVPAVPAPGAEVFASGFALTPGGGFNVLHAVRQVGADVVYCGPVGDGVLGEVVRRALDADGVEFAGAQVSGVDTGICVALTDDSAERTFLSTMGAECRVPLDAFDAVEPRDGQVLYISGYSLIDPTNLAALGRLARRWAVHADADAPTGPAGGMPVPGPASHPHRVLLDTSPMIGEVPLDVLQAMNAFDPIWSANERETRLLAATLGHDGHGPGHGDEDPIEALCAWLAHRLGATVICRVGPQGAWWSAGGPAVLVPSVAVTPVDTNGAGDAHSGVLCALLAEHVPLPRALRLANIAGALSTTRPGPATCPTLEEILARDGAQTAGPGPDEGGEAHP